jgi:hypothetical protein
MAVLLALGALVGCIIAGGILLGIGLTVIGLITMVAGVPVAFVVWITAGDRI